MFTNQADAQNIIDIYNRGPFFRTFLDATNPGAYQSAVEYLDKLQQNPLYVDPKAAASDPRGTQAQIIRSQWTDFEKNALPVVEQLRGMTTYAGNPGVVEGLKEQGIKDTETAFVNSIGTAQRNTARLGMKLTGDEQQALTKATNLGMAAAKVDAINRATDYQRDLNRQIVAGASGMSGGRSYQG